MRPHQLTPEAVVEGIQRIIEQAASWGKKLREERERIGDASFKNAFGTNSEALEVAERAIAVSEMDVQLDNADSLLLAAKTMGFETSPLTKAVLRGHLRQRDFFAA
jgi:hypothetical protein